MARRSYSDVPNRVVRIFLEQVSTQYDQARGRQPFQALTDEIRAFFGFGLCAYCGDAGADREEHVVPINKDSAGLHSWGNVVPACNRCNKLKGQQPWVELMTRLAALGVPSEVLVERTARLEQFITTEKYAPDVARLQAVAARLYTLTDAQTRGLIDFSLLAAAAAISGLTPNEQ